MGVKEQGIGGSTGASHYMYLWDVSGENTHGFGPVTSAFEKVLHMLEELSRVSF